MSKQVPEGVPSRDEQLASLRVELLGNKVFGRCRGRLRDLPDVFMTTAKESSSPTQFCGEWDDFVGQWRVMGNLLAKFRRDGWGDAYAELEKALTSAQYLWPGETVPLEATEPMTLVMFDPIRTMAMIHWLLEGHWMDLNNYLDWKDGVKRGYGPPDPRVTELFGLFSTLEKHARHRREMQDYEGWDLRCAYEDSVMKIFPEIDGSIGSRLSPRQIGSKITALAASLRYYQWNDHVEISDHAFVFACQAEQGEVLKHFNRSQQERLATWQFQVPKVLMGNGVAIGLHLEEEYGRWQGMFPALVSHGVSGGLGGLIMTNPAPEEYKLISHSGGVMKGEKFRVVFEINNPNPRLGKRRLSSVFGTNVERCFGEQWLRNATVTVCNDGYSFEWSPAMIEFALAQKKNVRGLDGTLKGTEWEADHPGKYDPRVKK